MTKSMQEEIKITRGLLARNSTWNFIGQVFPLFIMLFTLPYIVRGLGTEQFGILLIIYALINYFNIFGFSFKGISSKYIAESLGERNNERISSIFWTTFIYFLIIGCIGVIIFFLLVPLFAEHFFKVDQNLLIEMKSVFRMSAILIVVIIIRLFLNGVLEAYQKFKLINLINIPTNTLTFLIPAFVVFIGKGLTLLIFLIVIKELFCLISFFLVSYRIIPKIKYRLLDLKSSKQLFSFGGWLIITNIIAGITQNADKFLIGAILSMSAVTYYTIPYQIAHKIPIITASIISVLFPAVSLLNSLDRAKLERLFNQSLKFILMLIGLPVLILFVFSKEILILWLGNEFQQSIIVLQIIALNVILGSISWLLSIFLQGTGNPKPVAIIVLLLAPINIIVIWLMTTYLGIKGTALAMIMMTGLSTTLFYITCWRLRIFRISAEFGKTFLKTFVFIMPVVGFNIILKYFINLSVLSACINILILIILYTMIVWKYIVDVDQKHIITNRIDFFFSLIKLRFAKK